MILVTGATGFVGRHLIRRLSGAGEGVRCLVRAGSEGLEALAPGSVEVAVGHLLDAEAVAAACRGCRQIVHLAAPVHDVRDGMVARVQVEGMGWLIEGARQARVERILTVGPLGSASAAGLPFLRSRGQAEELLRQSGLPYVILQCSLMFGVGDRLVSGMLRLLQRTGVLVLPSTGKTMLQPIWVADVVSCLLRALTEEDALDRTIPIGGPQHLSYEEVADQVGRMLNVPRVKVHVSHRMAGWAARILAGAKLNPFPAYRHLELLSVGTITALDSVHRAFGFQPMPLIEGLAYQLLPGPAGTPSRPSVRSERNPRPRNQR
jgi:NADH dehydrogenase